MFLLIELFFVCSDSNISGSGIRLVWKCSKDKPTLGDDAAPKGAVSSPKSPLGGCQRPGKSLAYYFSICFCYFLYFYGLFSSLSSPLNCAEYPSLLVFPLTGLFAIAGFSGGASGGCFGPF